MKTIINLLTLTVLTSCISSLQATFTYDPTIDPKVKSYVENILAPVEKEFEHEQIHIKKSNRFSTEASVSIDFYSASSLNQLLDLKKLPKTLNIDIEEIKEFSLEANKFSIYHELGHIKNKHLEKGLTLHISQEALSHISQVILGMHILHIRQTQLKKIIPMILIIKAWPTGETLLKINPLYYNFCKHCEYQADAYAYQNVKSINAIRESLNDNKYMDNWSWIKKAYSTHPTYSERVAALEKTSDLENNQEQV